MWEIIGAGLTLIAAIVVYWLRKKSAEEKEYLHDYKEDIQEFDSALADGDTDTLSAKFDELRKKSGSNPRGQDDQEAG